MMMMQQQHHHQQHHHQQHPAYGYQYVQYAGPYGPMMTAAGPISPRIASVAGPYGPTPYGYPVARSPDAMIVEQTNTVIHHN
jgi:hypothetical protein